MTTPEGEALAGDVAVDVIDAPSQAEAPAEEYVPAGQLLHWLAPAAAE